MKPYYQDEAVTLYHGDCREIIPALGTVDAIVSDPPYGVAMRRGDSRNCDPVHGDDAPFDPTHLLALNVPTVLFGGNNFTDRLPVSRGWLVWDKTHHDKSQHSQAELAWTNCVNTIRIHREAYHGFMRKKDGWLHPTQKPVELFQWILGMLPNAALILDPYMGSGPLPVAAKNMGRKALGIDIEERYCEVAARRLSQNVLDLKGFCTNCPRGFICAMHGCIARDTNLTPGTA